MFTAFKPYRKVRAYIKGNMSLYSFFAKNLKDQAVVARQDTLLTVEAFQRSGNTFLWFLAKQVFGDDASLAHHTHSVANLKSSEAYNVPCVCVIREPLDSLVSSIIYRCADNYENYEKQFMLSMDDYFSFYKYVSLSEHIHLVRFEDLVNKTHETAELLYNIRFKGRAASGKELEEIVHAAKLKHHSYEKSKPTGLMLFRSTSFNQERGVLKEKVVDYINKHHHAEIELLSKFYADVLNGSNVLVSL